MGSVSMDVTGQAEINADAPCGVCGDPLVINETEPLEIAGIYCQHHKATHLYHVGCLPETVQVELMLAKMRHQGMIE